MKLIYYIIASIITYFIVVVFLNVLITENIEDKEFNKVSLPDIIHDNFEKLLSISTVNKILYIYLFYCFIRIITINYKYIPDVLFLIIILFLLRLITFSVTTVPPPYKLEKNKKLCKRKLFINKIGFSLQKIQYTCNDLMFSGHTVHIISFLLIILYFSKNLFEKILLSIISIIILFFIISSDHYSSDVVVAIIVTFNVPLSKI